MQVLRLEGYTSKNLIFSLGFNTYFKNNPKFYMAKRCLKIRTFHLQIAQLGVILFANLNGTSSFLFDFR
jgi:hypothetical protein